MGRAGRSLPARAAGQASDGRDLERFLEASSGIKLPEVSVPMGVEDLSGPGPCVKAAHWQHKPRAPQIPPEHPRSLQSTSGAPALRYQRLAPCEKVPRGC